MDSLRCGNNIWKCWWRHSIKVAGIELVDTSLVREAMDLARSASESFLYNHLKRSASRPRRASAFQGIQVQLS